MLRQIYVPVVYNPHFLTKKDSPLDISILRAAHKALLNQRSGKMESFLFVLCGGLTQDVATAAIASYGFPDAMVICIETMNEDGHELDDSDVREQVGNEISQWLETCHPSAITKLSQGEHDILDMWWSGVDTTICESSFLTAYATTLPDTHRKKAGTWLAILADILGLKEPFGVNDNKLILNATTLCEWLHGFEGASGNFYNGFEPYEICEALQITDYEIQGFLSAQCDENELLDETLCNAEAAEEDEDEEPEEVDDIDEIRSEALKQATSNERSHLRRKLSKYFGSDTALLWALHTAIWPQFDEPSVDLCSSLTNQDTAELSDAWEFVTTGWTDSADE